MEEVNSDSSSFFWSQSPKASSFPPPPPPPSSSSAIRPWIFALLASIFIVIIIPYFSLPNFLGFRPSIVKNSWGTLNLLLVVFAILCGLLGRDISSAAAGDDGERAAPPPEQGSYVGFRRMRSSSSYPDLRQEVAGDDWRFADDTQLFCRRRQLFRELESRSEPPFPPKMPPLSRPPPPPPPPPPPFRKLKSQRTAKDIATSIALFYSKKKRNKAKKIYAGEFLQPAAPTPPPPPALPQNFGFSQIFSQRKGGSESKRCNFNSVSTNKSSQPLPVAPSATSTKRKREKRMFQHTYPASPPSPLLPSPPRPLNAGDGNESYRKLAGDGKESYRKFAGEETTLPLAPRKKTGKNHTFLRTYPVSPPPPLPPPPPPPPPPSSPFAGDGNESYRKLAVDGKETHPNLAGEKIPSPLAPRKKTWKNPTFLRTFPVSPPPPLPPPPPPPPPPVAGHCTERHRKLAGEKTPSPLSPQKNTGKNPTFLRTHPVSPPPPPPPPPSSPFAGDCTERHRKFAGKSPLARRKNNGKNPTFLPTFPVSPPPPPVAGDCTERHRKFAGEETILPFCPSPDVNNKADLFIMRFREGLKMEKQKSIGIEMEIEEEIMMMMGLGGLSDP